jgi:hypothetical protein
MSPLERVPLGETRAGLIAKYGYVRSIPELKRDCGPSFRVYCSFPSAFLFYFPEADR